MLILRGSAAGLPDGIFSNRKSKFGYLLEGLRMDILWSFGIFYNHLVLKMASG
jgi:hypothetical protein